MAESAQGRLLPTAARGQLWAGVRRLLGSERRSLLLLLGLQAAATLAGLVGPWVLGVVVEAAAQHRLGRVLGPMLLLLAVATAVRSWLSWWVRRRGGRVGAGMLTRLRKQFLGDVLRLPLGLVERAGTGDLLTRATSDVDGLGNTVQRALPEIVVALVTVVLTAGALILAAPILALSLIPAAVVLTFATRWYLHRAPSAYLRERAMQTRVNGLIQESVEAGRTIEALRLGTERTGAVDASVGDWLDAELATLRLRTVYFPISEATYVVPLVVSVALGGVLHLYGLVSLAALTSATLYTQQLIDPVDTILSWLDRLQLAVASLARVLGVGQVERSESTAGDPEGGRLTAEEVHFAYRPRHDVVRGLSLDPEPGSRITIVGPSGSGKSTLALLLAGIYGPRLGRVTVGGAEVSRMAPEKVREELVLLTQEHHVFAGTLRDNLRLAAADAQDDELFRALETVGAGDWLRLLPEGIDTEVGSGGLELTLGQAEQVALARLLLADPQVLVLDEATALLNPRQARQLERSVARVLEGRTVVTVSHRLASAVDADLVLVMADGRVVEAGTHQELLAAAGGYAALWHAYQGEVVAPPARPGRREKAHGGGGGRRVDAAETGI